MAYEFKKLNDVEIVETPIDTANVLIEEDGVIKKAPKGAVGGGIQPDWNQNDSTQPDYVKNRPFWTDDPEETMLYTKTSTNPMELANVMEEFVVDGIEIGKEYTVSLFGKIYNCVAYVWTAVPNSMALGFADILNGETPEENKEPFGFVTSPDHGMTMLKIDVDYISELDSSLTEFTFSISGITEISHAIDAKYLPAATNGGRGVWSAGEIRNVVQSPIFVNVFTGATLKELRESLPNTNFYFINANAHTVWVMDAYGSGGATFDYVFKGIDISTGQYVTVKYKFPDDSDDAVLSEIDISYPNKMYLTKSDKTWSITVDDAGTISATQVS